MCGISGSRNATEAFDLYEKNLTRGAFSSGCMVVGFKETSPGTWVPAVSFFKTAGTIARHVWEAIVEVANTNGYKASYFLFHNRAPTNNVDASSDSESIHPFKFEKYWAAHNGVISNFKTLEDGKYKDLDIDSKIIPRLLSDYKEDTKRVVEMLEGLFSCWIVNIKTGQIDIIKAGSSLYFSYENSAFSSLEFTDSEPLQDGQITSILPQFKGPEITSFNYFKYSNPYFI